ncbi:MAG: glycosyltransferase family 4 protein [Dehalococcoidia bacterium]|nr:glycosyltransferase family 4 protein [Dehalococcoidia bacterium]
MKILLVQDTDWLLRGPHQQHHLTERLSLKGHEVRVIDYELLWRTQGKKELRSKRQVFDNVSRFYDGAKLMLIRPGIIKIPWLDYVSSIFSYRKEIHHQIKDFCPDVIIGFGILNTYLAMRAAKKNNIPFVYYWIDVLHRLIPFEPFHPIAKSLESKTLRQADKVLVISEKLKDYVKELGASPERTQMLRAGIDIERFDPVSKGDTIRQHYGFTEKDIVLFFMGWLYQFSGLKEVASQLARIDNLHLKLLIVGEGDAYETLQQIREKHNLEDKIILTGKKPYQEIPEFIAASDVCLLPAYPDEKIMQDIVPIKMYEYMAMKKPVIATRLPGVMKEFGEDNGVVYVDKPEDAVTKATELIQSGKIEELGQKARSFVERYSWENITDEFEKILKEAIEEKQNEQLSKRIQR